LATLLSVPARAAEDMAFTVHVYPYGITGFTIVNESRERIVGFTITSGNTGYKFDKVYDGYVYGPSGRSAVPALRDPDYVSAYEVVGGGKIAEVLRWSDITSFDRGDSMTFYVQTWPYVNNAQTLFNNGTEPNAVVTVFGENGGRGELTLGDTLHNDLNRT
jgi:hypothetical protein